MSQRLAFYLYKNKHLPLKKIFYNTNFKEFCNPNHIYEIVKLAKNLQNLSRRLHYC